MISFCLIVKDEEKWIEDCLTHLKPIASQIIVGDTGSSDRTFELAKACGAEVFQMPWEQDFAKARNATIERAREPWIFSFDADERISAQDLLKFKALIERLNSQKDFEAIRLNRRNYCTNLQVSGFQPSQGEYPEEKDFPGFYREQMVRIFRNLPHIRWRGKVHELIDPQLKGKIFESDLTFHHYGYIPEEEARRKKTYFYQEYGRKKLEDDPNNWKARYDLGSEYIQGGEIQKAVEELERARALNPKEPMILSNLGFALMEAGKMAEGEQVLRDCLVNYPTYHDALLNLGVSLMRQNRYEEATSFFDQLLKAHPQSFLAYRNYGLCCIHLKRLDQAVEKLEKALSIFPQFADAKLDLAAVHFMAGMKDRALQEIREIYAEDPANGRASDMLRQLGAL